MKKCWLAQVMGLSTLYSVLTQSEELLLQHGVRSQSTTHDPYATSAEAGLDEVNRDDRDIDETHSHQDKLSDVLVGCELPECHSTPLTATYT